MMKYMLDTNACIRLLKGDSSVLLQHIESLSSNDILIPSIVRFELYYGAYKSVKREENLIKLNDFFDCFETVHLDEFAAHLAGKIRACLERNGTPIGPYDLLIAATALTNNSTLITHNTKEFSRVQDLIIEDWEI